MSVCLHMSLCVYVCTSLSLSVSLILSMCRRLCVHVTDVDEVDGACVGGHEGCDERVIGRWHKVAKGIVRQKAARVAHTNRMRRSGARDIAACSTRGRCRPPPTRAHARTHPPRPGQQGLLHSARGLCECQAPRKRKRRGTASHTSLSLSLHVSAPMCVCVFTPQTRTPSLSLSHTPSVLSSARRTGVGRDGAREARQDGARGRDAERVGARNSNGEANGVLPIEVVVDVHHIARALRLQRRRDLYMRVCVRGGAHPGRDRYP
jgi:hypothetical protein